MNTKLIVVRHAQGEGNHLGIFQGQWPSDLTELGIKQAQCTAEFLKDTVIDAAFASDLPRALNTAKIIAQAHGIEVEIDEGLREINGGLWEGMKFDDIAADYQKDYAIWKNDLGNCTCPDGESVRHLQQRVKETIESLVKKHAGKTVLIATHAMPIRTMACIWKGLDICEIVNLPWVPNASVTIVNYDSQTLCFEIEAYALCEHLKDKDLITELPKNI